MPAPLNTVIVVQARMGSTRLPGKVLLEVLGKPLLEYQLERLRRVRLAQQVVIATTTGAADEPVAALCRRLGVAHWRGPEHDVLARYHGAALAQRADVVVRVTADCPLIDPQLIDEAIGHYLAADGALDYVSNGLEPSYPRGMDVEVFAFRALGEAFAEAADAEEREHVTPFIYRRPQRYRLSNLACPDDLSAHRWTVDLPEDFELVREVIERLYPGRRAFGMRDIVALLDAHPELVALNAHVEQKQLTQQRPATPSQGVANE